jgi:Uncharacterized conserved protein
VNAELILERLPSYIERVTDINRISNKHILIDSLLGTGVKGTLKDPLLSIIKKVNSLSNQVISIDLPSGMMSEFGNTDQTVIKADITLTLEFPKLACFLPEAGEHCGEIITLPIGLSREYIERSASLYHYIKKDYIQSIRLKREKFSHKGTYGHALLICGSKGMAGAATLRQVQPYARDAD